MFTDVFSNDYANEYINWYGLQEGEHDDVVVKFVKLMGVLPSYLHKEYHIGDVSIPVLYVKGELWMSLSPMEIQSCEYALNCASGDIATAGLGMGYFALRAAEDEDVTSIDIYEINPDVINFFIQNFSEREGFEKMNFILGDVREEMKGKTYEFVYNDIYQTMLPDEVITDMELLCDQNDIDVYIFWGYELVIWAGSINQICLDSIRNIPFMLKEYFTVFLANNERTELAKSGWDLPDNDFVFRAITTTETCNRYGLP